MIMNTAGRGKAMGNGKNIVVFEKYRLEIMMHKGCLNCLNDIELRNNVRIVFFEEILYLMGIDYLRGACCDVLELMLLEVLFKMHGQFLKIHEDGTKSV
jgi:hypothetical protein